MLIEYVINKINNYSKNDDNSLFEGVLIVIPFFIKKLIHSGLGSIVKIYCYYLVSNFNHEFTSSFL